jgi:carboxyl-terminal processing protease
MTLSIGRKRLIMLLLFLALLPGALLLRAQLGTGDEPRAITLQRAEAKTDGARYNLASMVILTRVISYVKNYYYDPARIESGSMFRSALEEVARSIPSVMVDFNDNEKQVYVRVDTQEKSFPFGDVTSIWKVQYRLSEIFRFIQPHLESNIDPKDVEYAAINGILSTLDPHSVQMTPRIYRELRLNTMGNFGGIGIQIGIRDGELTVISPIIDTPAWKAGLKAKDTIAKIEGQSTVNMSLDEAVQLMRGKRGTKVTVTIMRKGWQAPRDFDLIRDTIPIISVYSKLLPGSIGYVMVTNFQGNTTQELQDHITRMKAAGPLKGLVFDLRGNPGGLLDAAVKVSDLFLDSGTIVTTVGAGNERLEVSEATFVGTEEKYPMVVLVGPGSASASEIVAGALKNNNRAVLVGERTFGKGSVQVLYDMDDGSALKLTVAQYLTPGDVSIQSVGVIPDITLRPVFMEPGNVEFYSYEKRRREGDLDHHLNHTSTVAEKSFETLYYLWDEKRDEIDVEAPPEQVNTDDYVTQFGYELLRHIGNISRREIVLQRSVDFLKKMADDQEAKIVKEFKDFNVDWAQRDNGGTSSLSIDFSTKPAGALSAGDEIELTLKATNTGKAAITRLRAMTDSDNPYLDGLEFFLGYLEPGKSASWTAKVALPKDLESRTDDVVFRFFETDGQPPEPVTHRVEIKGRKLPVFAYTFQVIDPNGDGLIQTGEKIELIVDIDNIGDGDVVEGLATLKNSDNLKDVFINAGRASIDPLKPGQRGQVRFNFDVKAGMDKNIFPMEITIVDTALREFLHDKIYFHIESAQGHAPAVIPDAKSVEIPAMTPIFGSPDERLPEIARNQSPVTLQALATMGNWVKLRLSDARFGWAILPNASLKKLSGKASDLTIDTTRRAPAIAVSEASLISYTDSERIQLDGVVTDNNHVQDMYILRNGKKVYFKSNKTAANPLEMSFSAIVELEEGTNTIVIIARETEDFVGRRAVMVYRKKSPEKTATNP